MKQFDVYDIESGRLFCVTQHGFLLDRATIMVAPLTRYSGPLVDRLTPAVTLDGREYVLDVAAQIPVRAAPLRNRQPVVSLAEHRDPILDAINLLYWGL